MEGRSNFTQRGKNVMLDGILEWIQRHPRMFVGGVIAFIAGLLYHWLGFWDTLVLITLVTIGLIVGKYLDERKELGQVLDRLFTSDQ